MSKSTEIELCYDNQLSSTPPAHMHTLSQFNTSLALSLHVHVQIIVL